MCFHSRSVPVPKGDSSDQVEVAILVQKFWGRRLERERFPVPGGRRESRASAKLSIKTVRDKTVLCRRNLETRWIRGSAARVVLTRDFVGGPADRAASHLLRAGAQRGSGTQAPSPNPSVLRVVQSQLNVKQRKYYVFMGPFRSVIKQNIRRVLTPSSSRQDKLCCSRSCPGLCTFRMGAATFSS